MKYITSNQAFYPVDENSILVTDGNKSAIINADDDELVFIPAIGYCYIRFGIDPTASASDSMYMADGSIMPFILRPKFKVSVYGGNITITK